MALYDPRETVEAPSLDFTLRDVLDFARSKDPDERYPFFSCTACALHQFLRHRGLKLGWGEATALIDGVVATGPFALAIATYPWTFGALARRLEAVVGE